MEDKRANFSLLRTNNRRKKVIVNSLEKNILRKKKP